MASPSAAGAPPNVLAKLWRETSRPFRRRTWRKWAKAGHPEALEFEFLKGSVEPVGLELLARKVKEAAQHAGPIVEIGTLFGRTTTHLALAKTPGQRIITVDNYGWNPWGYSRESHYELTSSVLWYLRETGHVEQVRMDKAEFYRTYRGPAPAIVFLDANHTYEETKKDIEWALAAGAKTIAGHDYSPTFPGVQQIVDEHGGPAELGGTVWVLRSAAKQNASA
jgi:hypothetical protein